MDPAAEKECPRCHRPFKPVWQEAIKIWSRFCEDCQIKNLFDWLELPTPPDMLDQHTKRPCLTKEEFRRKLQEEQSDSN